MEKQFLPLQVAPVLFCFLIPADSTHKGWEAGAVACRGSSQVPRWLPAGSQGHPSTR